MPERQIALASTWFHRDGQHVTAHRGEFVEIPDNEIERLEKLGALVPEGGELDRPGKLIPLLANSSAEHVQNYIESGKTDEILEQAAEYPTALVERILIAERAGQNREALVKGLEARVRGENELTEPITVPDVLRPVSTDFAPDTLVEDGVATETGTTGGEEDLVEFASTNTVDAIVERAGDDPELARALREAEESRTDREPRSTLIEQLSKIETPPES